MVNPRSIATATLLVVLSTAAPGCKEASTGSASITDNGAAPLNPDSSGVCLGSDGTPLPLAPDSARVDLAEPSFSHPTSVTNPLFPVSRQLRVLQLGTVDGLPFRAEVTLLPDFKSIDVNGDRVETLVSQYAAFLDGRIHEVALDFYAQGDEGAAYYFGEDVYNYEDGLIADTDGTWLAGRDGPVAMIMPANPQVGDVYRPENICGVVFEEVTVRSVDLTVDGPRGPVAGAIAVGELHMDGAREDKTFAPGYGEFFTGAGGDVEAVALAVPEDALPGLPPVALETLYAGALELFDAAPSEDWDAFGSSLGEMTAAWEAFREGDVPPLLELQMDSALSRLAGAAGDEEPHAARQTALEVTQAALDLQLQYRSAAEVDLDLLDLWARRLAVAADEGDRGAVLGDAATLKWIRDRVARDVGAEQLKAIDARLAGLAMAVRIDDLSHAAEAAATLRATLERTRATARQR